MESIILILVMLGTFGLGYFTVNLLIDFFEGDKESRYQRPLRKNRRLPGQIGRILHRRA
jgi:hypothetical protein